ncbi:alpha/beta hydrolase-fold protein [Kineosporia babensis]
MLLTGAAGAALSGAAVAGSLSGVLPGRRHLREALGIGQAGEGVPDAGGAEPQFETFDSAARGTQVTFGWVTPPNQKPDGLPVILVLHGRGDDAHSVFDSLGMHQFLAAHVEAGGKPAGVVSVDGGEAYWHPRANDDDPLSMLSDELLPRVAELGFNTANLGVMGYSMGGFGALLLARESSHQRFVPIKAAAASSPALFAQASATSAGSFDDAADFQRWGALSDKPDVKNIPLSVSCGVDDPFSTETERYREACDPTPAGSIGNGAHNHGYWRAQVPAQLRFLTDRLS